MKYGAMNFPVKPVMDEIKKIAGLGFDYIELTLDPPCAHYSDINAIENKLVRELDQLSMEVVCHLPTFVYTADLAPGIRRASLEEMIGSLKTAARIHAKKAVLHPSVISGLGPLVLETANTYAQRSFNIIVKEAEALGLPLCFENMFPRYHGFFDSGHFLPVLKKFPELNLTLDAGHANIDDPDGTRLFNFIQQFPDRIGHIHVSDNHGKYDEHLKIGKGHINFEAFAAHIKQSGYNDMITLEIFSPDVDDLVKSRDRISSLFD